MMQVRMERLKLYVPGINAKSNRYGQQKAFLNHYGRVVGIKRSNTVWITAEPKIHVSAP